LNGVKIQIAKDNNNHAEVSNTKRRTLHNKSLYYWFTL